MDPVSQELPLIGAVLLRWRVPVTKRRQLLLSMLLVQRGVRPALLIDGFPLPFERVSELACLPSPLFVLIESTTEYAAR